MKEYLGTNKNSIIRWILAIAAIVVISWFIPHKDQKSYKYAMGRPWMYSLLTAPFDIPINLDSASMEAKRDSIDRSFVAIYKRDSNVDRKAILELSSDLQKRTSLSGYNRNHLVERVRRLYVDGIVDNEAYDMIKSGEMPEVRFVVDNVAEPSSTARMRSVRAAYNLLDSTFTDYETQHAMSQISITRYLLPNVRYDSIESKRMLDQLYQKALAPIGIMQKGERIINRGDIVTPQIYELLKTYEKLAEDRLVSKEDYTYTRVGQVAVITMLIASLYVFLIYFRRSIMGNMKKLIFLMSFIVLFTVIAFLIISTFTSGVYIVPFALLPVIITTFFDSRTALFTHLVEILICAIVVTFPLEFMLLQFITGVTAIVTVQELSKRSQLVQCAIYIFLMYSLVYVAAHIISEGVIAGIDYHVIGCFGINAILFSFAYVLIFLIEKIFGFTSTVTLVELNDVNSPVLRELSDKCPGTFQHSLQVSTLAAEAAHAIGANSLLARAGGLYHDIGKIDNPAFFTENQRGENPHTALTPDLSARIVIEHVQNGLRRAVKAKLPQIIMDFIVQHHGCGKAKFFYTQACNANPDSVVDPEPYTYPGPNPQTKETSILMMADATEAASRSLKNHSDESIRELVERIIDGQIADGMFRESPISFRDVEKIKQTFIDRLCTIYHTRVEYPDAIKKQ